LQASSASGTHSPFGALHKFGSYQGFIYRAFPFTGPVSLDPIQTFAAPPWSPN